MSYVFSLADKLSQEKEELSYHPFNPIYPENIDPDRSIIDQIKEEDKLLFFPFESMDPYLQLLKEASNDPEVISIKITIYRLASISKVAEYLANAAENGKEVVALMELRARFDESNNIDWSERLEEAGCTIIYGFEDFKVHSKITLITRHHEGKIEYISQFGTGNYNEKTAKMYTDLSLMTADKDFGLDSQKFFTNMMISNLSGDYDKLLVAPNGIKNTLINLIDEEITRKNNGEEALIRLKCNSITERDVIDALARASRAGVKVKLSVRGICCLIPGVKGKTDNIEVTSVIGRYLEHPRIYIFGPNERAKVYIGSSDLMTRNLVRRVEICVPVLDEKLKKKVIKILDTIMDKNNRIAILNSDSSYTHLNPNKDSCQEIFIREATLEKNRIESRKAEKETLSKANLSSSEKGKKL